jgi:hypothetical protein
MARSELDKAVKSLDSINRRHVLVNEFNGKVKEYIDAKQAVDRRSSLLSWILQQVPLIGLESKPTKVAVNDPIGAIDGKRGL